MRNTISNIKIISGNIFTSKCQTIVNTVNCVGVMGAGIALEYKLRYPQMYERYYELCQKEMFQIGTLWIYKINSEKMVLNFPTKIHWKNPSKKDYLIKGLEKFKNTYWEKGITSIAFPLLGAEKGGINPDVSLKLMKEYLITCQIPIEIYKYDLSAYDDLYLKFRENFLSTDVNVLKNNTKLRLDYIKRISKALHDKSIKSMSKLATVNGIGVKSLEKVFRYAMNELNKELELFN